MPNAILPDALWSTLYGWDIAALFALNVAWSWPALDIFWGTLTQLHKQGWFLIGILPALIVYPLVIYGKEALKIFVILGVTVAITDAAAYRGIKSVVHRERPFRNPELTWLQKKGEAHGYSFPSNHAANSFAAAGVLSVFYRRLRYAFYAFALLIGLSRPILGVHYPSDVLAGAVLGSAVALTVIRAGRLPILNFSPKIE